jgi:lambda family phage portal protein
VLGWLKSKAKASYESAKFTRRTAGWYAPSTGPNREIAQDLPSLRNRHRDLARNNPWARRAIQAVTNNTVGPGIPAQWSDPEQHARWTAWWESTACDADGRQNGYGLQALIMRTVVESGACLVRRRPRRPGDRLPIPLQLQVIEPDWIDHSKTESVTPGGGYIVNGVEFDAIGRRVAYWIFREHPGDVVRATGMDSERHDARDFAHVFRADRPGQVHGVPWGVASMMRMRMLDDYQDAQLERHRIAACYTAFVHDTPDAINAAAEEGYELLDKLEPGAIELLPPGKDIVFASPPQPENDREFRLGILQAIAADYGVPYEVLTGDLSEVNFSSARMGWNEFARNIDVWRWQMLAPQLFDPIVRWFHQAEIVAGLESSEEMPLWTAPARTMVDPTREIPAMMNAVRAGFMSLPEAIRKQGYDPEILAREHAQYMQLLDSLGVRFDSDARHAPNSSPPEDEESSASTSAEETEE